MTIAGEVPALCVDSSDDDDNLAAVLRRMHRGTDAVDLRFAGLGLVVHGHGDHHVALGALADPAW